MWTDRTCFWLQYRCQSIGIINVMNGSLGPWLLAGGPKKIRFVFVFSRNFRNVVKFLPLLNRIFCLSSITAVEHRDLKNLISDHSKNEGKKVAESSHRPQNMNGKVRKGGKMLKYYVLRFEPLPPLHKRLVRKQKQNLWMQI